MNPRLFLLPALLASLLFVASAGAQPVKKLWSVRHHGGLSYLSYYGTVGISIGADSAGNVFVAGYAVNRARKIHSYVAKYAAADGALLWEEQSHDPIYGGYFNQDRLSTLAVDSVGNVVVNLRFDRGDGISFSTRKYAAADGALLWEHHFNRLNPAGILPIPIVIDQADNVVASGRYDSKIGSFVTDKYAAANGKLLWSMRGANTALNVDGVGNAVVAGTHKSRRGFHFNPYAAKFAAADGKRSWLNAPLDYYSKAVPQSLAVDRTGNIAITGYFEQLECFVDQTEDGGESCDYYPAGFYTFKLSSSGKPLWKNLTFGPYYDVSAGTGVVTDSTGDVIVTGYNFYECSTVKYAAEDGAILWEKAIPGGESISAIILDASDNVVIGCTLARSDTDYHCVILTTKLAPDGTRLWSERHTSTGDKDDFANGLVGGPGYVVASAAAGNVIDDDDAPTDIVIVKYADGATPQTFAPDRISITTATLHGMVNPNGFETNVAFEFGTDPALAGAVIIPPVAAGDGTAAVPVDAVLTSLNPVTTYYYRLTATANGNTTRGAIRQFTTPPRTDIVHPSQAKTR